MKYSALISCTLSYCSGTSESAKIASTGHAETHAPQSMHTSGSMIEHLVIVFAMNAIDRTNVHARLVLGADAWFGDDVGHGRYNPLLLCCDRAAGC